METRDSERYMTFPASDVGETIQESVVSHEEICDPSEDRINSDNLEDVAAADANSVISEVRAGIEILTERSDEEDDEEKAMIYPIYIKEEEHNYTSGDDESMAVEALRQLGGMYPCFEENGATHAEKCDSSDLAQADRAKSKEIFSLLKLTCPTCGDSFERKEDLSNHTARHRVDRPHACRTCGNLFRSKSHLHNHTTKAHRAEKPHKCTICGSDFNRPSSLSNHMKIHTYVAGRALVQTQTNANAQPEVTTKAMKTEESENSTGLSTNYDVQWSVPYNFQQGVQVMTSSGEKMDGLQELAVMPNGEVAQFEYPCQDAMAGPIQYNISSMNNFPNSDAIKIDPMQLSASTSGAYQDANNSGAVKLDHACSHCGATFSRLTALTSHEKIHSTKAWSMPIECEYCDKQFQDSNHLATHRTTCARKFMEKNVENGKRGKHACAECGKKFTTKQKMFRHQWIHRKKTHCCEICGAQFEKQNQLDEHRLSAHPGDSPFTCTECGKSFVSRQGLWEHGRTHAGSPAHFHCDTCSKTFSSRQGYLIHHRTHTGERPYGCKYCWKAFRDGGTLRKHERIHTGERPHVCPLCSRAFNQKVVLREHVRWVHAAGKNETEVIGPPYPCPLCGALNQDRDELCAHIVKHSDQMIAEAKAKTTNIDHAATPEQQKVGKKKSRSTAAKVPRLKNLVQPTISQSEQHKALLSIAPSPEDPLLSIAPSPEDRSFNKDMQETLLLIDRDIKDIDTESSLLEDDPRKRLEGETLLVSGDTAIITKISQRDVLQLIQSSKRHETLRLLTTTSKTNDTLHLITKQNESLPVLTIRNHPQSHHGGYSSQLSELSGVASSEDDITDHGIVEGDCLVDEQVSVHEDTKEFEDRQAAQSGDDDGDEDEMVCGICGDDFDDKNILMEHVKIHI